LIRSGLFTNISTGGYYDDVESRATYKGVCVKTFILLALTIASAALVAFYLPSIIEAEKIGVFIVLLIVSSIVAFICAIAGRMSERAAKYCAVLYSVCEGLVIGCVSALIESYIPGAVYLAAFATIVIFTVMLVLFSIGLLRSGSMLARISLGILFGAIALALFTMIASLFVSSKVYIGLLIGVEAIFLIYGAITLTFDFEEARYVVSAGCSKNAEWSVALGLMISLIYIYIQALRLIQLIYELKN